MFLRFGRRLAGPFAIAVLAILGAPSAALALEPETSAYLARCTTQPDTYFTQAADAFIKSGKDQGWWDSVIGLYFFCAPTQQAGLINVKGSTLTLTVSGSVQFTPYTGMKGDGSTGYLDTGSTPANITGFELNSHSMFVFSQTDSNALAGDVGASNGGSTLGLRLHYGSLASVWSANNSAMTFSNTTGVGLSGFVRSGSNTGYWVRNDATTSFSGTTVGFFPTTTFRFLRQGASAYFSANQLAFGLIGSGSMTPAQAAQIYPACVAMLASLGTWRDMEPEMQSYINRCPSDTPWDLKFVLAANEFIKEAKTSGWWSHMADVHFFCAPTLGAALVNAKADTLHLTVSGSVANNAWQGVQGMTSSSTSTATGFLQTGSTAAQISGFSLNSNSMFVFCQSDVPSLGGELGSLGGGSNVGVRVRNAAQASVWSATATQIPINVQSGRGLTGFVRADSTGVSYVKYHVQPRDTDGMTYKIQTSGTLPTGQVNFLRLGTSQYFSRNELAFGFIGDGSITATQTQDMYNSCMKMLGDDGLGTLQQDPPVDSVAPPHAFGRSDVNTDPLHTHFTPTDMQVFRLAAPPSGDNVDFSTSYPYGPLTDVVTRPWGVALTSTDSQVGRWELIWSDRAMIGWAKKPNDTMVGITGGTELANDHFSDNERSTQSLPSSIAWYGGTTSDLSMSGSTMVIAPGGSALGYFQPAGSPQLLQDGDSILARFSIVVSGTSLPATDDFFRVALLNSSATATDHYATGTASRATADNYSPSVTSHYGGYMFTAPVNPTAANKLKDYAHLYTSTASPTNTTSYTQVSTTGGSGGYGFVASQTYVGTLKVLQSGTQTTETLTFTGSFAHGTSATWTHSRTDTTGTSTVSAFDTLAFSTGTGAGLTSVSLDDIAVIYYNSAAPISCRTEFTTYCKAIGSTLVKTAYSAGLKFRDDPDHPDHKGWGDIAEEWGYNVDAWQARWDVNQNDPIFTQDMDVDMGDISHYAFYSDPGHVPALFTNDAVDGSGFKTTHDRVILGLGRLADIPMAKGFVIDHEHADDRGSDLEVKFITEMGKIAHCKQSKEGHQFILGALGHVAAADGSGGHCGWTADNANSLLNLFDWYNLVVGASPVGQTLAGDTLTTEYNFFKGPSGTLTVPEGKLCVAIQVGAHGQEISLADTAEVRDFIAAHPGILKCYISPNYASFGGDLSRAPNQVISTLLNLPTH